MVLNTVAAFAVALLSGLGVGGGGLFAVYLALASDIPQLAVQGLNLLFFLFSSGASVTVQLLRRGIRFFAVGIMVASGTVGVIAGSLLSGVIGGEYLRQLFGIMLMSGGVLSLKSVMRKSDLKNQNPSANSDADRQNTSKNDSERAEK